eukprot:snap_masked-scaffold_13-processed-gene-4.27-mRNA-1 protein AED:0.11 eAED:0.11 QI:0/-1/0/1/-1/1/1/0/108
MAQRALQKSVLSKYKQLLRASRTLFKNDQIALKASHAEIRQHFEGNKGVRDSEAIHSLLKDVDEAIDMIENNFVQARMNERGSYQVALKPGDSARAIDITETKANSKE